MTPQFVVTVHGINSDGEWQKEVHSVLERHFRCVGYRYRTYRYFGFALPISWPHRYASGNRVFGDLLGPPYGCRKEN